MKILYMFVLFSVISIIRTEKLWLSFFGSKFDLVISSKSEVKPQNCGQKCAKKNQQL